MARGTIIVRADDENDRLSVNTHILNEKKISNMSLAEKHDYMKNELLNGIGKNTFEVSYTGRVPFSGLDKYILNFEPIIDMSLSGGISIEIFSLGDCFCINVMQRNVIDKYFCRFVELFTEYNIIGMWGSSSAHGSDSRRTILQKIRKNLLIFSDFLV